MKALYLSFSLALLCGVIFGAASGCAVQFPDELPYACEEDGEREGRRDERRGLAILPVGGGSAALATSCAAACGPGGPEEAQPEMAARRNSEARVRIGFTP